MFGTIFSILLALAVFLLSAPHSSLLEVKPYANFLVLIPALLLLGQLIIFAFSLQPLQKAEQNLTPRILDLFKRDFYLKVINGTLIALSLLILFLTLDNSLLNPLHPAILPVAWLLYFGISFDLFHWLINRILSYLNPFEVVQMFNTAAKQSVERDRELDLCNWIESMSEVGVKSLQRSSTSLCNTAIDEMRETLRIFLDSSKSIAHETKDKQSQALGIEDRVSYTLFYSLGRLDFIYQKALDLQLEPVCSTIISTLGKLIVYAARYDLSLVSTPVHFLGKFSVEAEEKKMPEIALKGSCTLLEVSKVILNEIDVTYLDLKEPFFSIINQLDATEKEAFRNNKRISIALLTQPFRDLKDLFQTEKIVQHQDTPVIIGQIDRVLSEWETLDVVLRTMPPIPNIDLPKEPEPEKGENENAAH